LKKIVTIQKVTRNKIIMTYGDRNISISGEAYVRGHGSPDFVAISSSLKAWDAPHAQDPLDDATRLNILAGLKQRMAERQMTIECE
jgi:hypothetical protein